MSPEFITILISALPIGELRAGLPVALFSFNLPPLKAYLLSVFGNFLPVIPLLLLWHYVIHSLGEKIPFLRSWSNWIFEKTRVRHGRSFEVLKSLALFIFVMVPMPLTGAWSGTVAGFVFGVPFWRSVLLITLGILASGLIMLFGAGLFL